MTAEDIIAQLALEPHPEGGWYRQTWQSEVACAARASGTCIYFLLKPGERSHWHRVDAVEIWHHYAGATLTLRVSEAADGPAERFRLGRDLRAGERPQVMVPKDAWQSAENTSAEDWGLVGCTVSPGFRFEGFTLAEPAFDIPGLSS